jgi:catechol 2,3-dioxygenase-like lactoylglutathione lyase family enzyme
MCGRTSRCQHGKTLTDGAADTRPEPDQNGGMGASFAVPVLRVADAERAVTWYERLGFAEEWRHRFEPGLPLYVGIARDATARLHLSEHTGDARPDTLVYLYVPDVDALAAACGVTEIDEMPWGRDFEVTDPDRNRIRVGTPRA